MYKYVITVILTWNEVLKAKVHPITGHEGQEGEEAYSCTL